MATHSSILAWRKAWWATVHGVAKSWTRLSRHTHLIPYLYIEVAKKFFWFFPEDGTEKPDRTFLVNLIQARAYINAQFECCACGRAETQTKSLCMCRPAACFSLSRLNPGELVRVQRSSLQPASAAEGPGLQRWPPQALAPRLWRRKLRLPPVEAV